MKRQLTIRFHRAVTDPKAETLEVVVTPLSSANQPVNDQTILGLKKTVRVTLVEPVTPIVFELTPSYEIGLDNPILYRIAWRRGSFGRIESREFSMPDQNVDFEDLFDLGYIVSGESYLTQDDLGVPGGAARLNEAGQVLDANGNVILSGNTAMLQSQLNNEIMQRQSADSNLRSELFNEFSSGLASLNTARANALAGAVTTLNAAVSAEAATRSQEDAGIRASLAGIQNSVTSTANVLRTEFSSASTALDIRKADLVNGKIPANQLPDIALGTTVVVADQAEMLQLTSVQVQPGDLAVRPDGTFMLVLPLPDDPGSWRKITAGAAVSSVNEQTGAVVLSANDVGARSSTAPVPMADILGLSSALASKANGSQITSLAATVSTESGKLATLTGQVNGMAGAWQQAVSDAETSANNAADSASDAATTANNISGVHTAVLGVKTEITQLQTAINSTVSTVNTKAAQVATDTEYVEDLVAVQVTALAILNDQFGDLGQLVTSVNGILPNAQGNITIYGGGTTLTLVEDPQNPGLYHVTGA